MDEMDKKSQDALPKKGGWTSLGGPPTKVFRNEQVQLRNRLVRRKDGLESCAE